MKQIKKILSNVEELNGTSQVIKGWVISNRGNSKIRFLAINDGSTFESIQVVLKEEEKINLEEIDKLRIGSAILINGEVLYTPTGKQSCEIKATSFEILSIADEDFPLQKQGMSKEFLREIPHLRHRTNIGRAVMRIRSTLSQEIHKYFAEKDFLLAAAPIITSNDGEGAGETFVINEEGKDGFFDKKAMLGVTGQLHAESYANGFGKVYTFAPTFRAENSHTQRHASEFWMVEPEVAFADLKEIVSLSDDMLKQVIKNTLEKLPKEFDFLESNSEGLIKKLNDFINTELKILDYKDAIAQLEKVKDRFKENNISFGIDLSTEHEKYLAKEFIGGPVAIINYPKDIKAFYMHQNDDNKTVAAFDLLVPGIGELVGGSQRECNYEKILTRIKEMDINQNELQWYLDLRRFGQAQSSGFGLGFERLVMYVTGIDNIRDTLPFPRTPGKLLM
ncbi:MAG: asparagine--tRNA ligase [Mycoplasma sp.]|nr:asparagine--tRNA ligase [Mycoplasma sp.]